MPNSTQQLPFPFPLPFWHIMKNADIVLFASKRQTVKTKQQTANKFVLRFFFRPLPKSHFVCSFLLFVPCMLLLSVGKRPTILFINVADCHLCHMHFSLPIRDSRTNGEKKKNKSKPSVPQGAGQKSARASDKLLKW